MFLSIISTKNLNVYKFMKTLTLHLKNSTNLKMQIQLILHLRNKL